MTGEPGPNDSDPHGDHDTCIVCGKYAHAYDFRREARLCTDRNCARKIDEYDAKQRKG